MIPAERFEAPPHKARLIPLKRIAFEAGALVQWTDRLAALAGQLDPLHVHLFGQLHPIFVFRSEGQDGNSWTGVAGVVSYTLARALLPPASRLAVRDVSKWNESERAGLSVADALLTPLLLSEAPKHVRGRLIDLLDSGSEPEVLKAFPKALAGGDSYWARLLGCSRQTLARLRASRK